jgi:hypothetical protein
MGGRGRMTVGADCEFGCTGVERAPGGAVFTPGRGIVPGGPFTAADAPGGGGRAPGGAGRTIVVA